MSVQILGKEWILYSQINTKIKIRWPKTQFNNTNSSKVHNSQYFNHKSMAFIEMKRSKVWCAYNTSVSPQLLFRTVDSSLSLRCAKQVFIRTKLSQFSKHTRNSFLLVTMANVWVPFEYVWKIQHLMKLTHKP